MFHPIDPKQSFPRLEEEILKYWKKKKTFEKSVKNRPKTDEYVFYDGPPFATGLPHYGHILAGTMKDVVPRYWTMRGKRVERVFGWDCHGLPVEYQIEKELGLNGKKEIEEKMGIAAFNEACRKNVLRYTHEWEKTVERMGRWVDFKNAYLTMDPNYMESIWWVFKTLWDKKLIYRGHKSMHICPRCATPLSNFEVTQGYKDVRDPSIYIKFRSKKNPNTYFLAWTTTPWTLPGNCALAVGADIEYIEIKTENETFILAKTVWEHWKASKSVLLSHFIDAREGDVKKGSEFIGEKYEPLYDFYADVPCSENAWKIYHADFVKVEEGTGIVHTAPAFGEEDLAFGRERHLPFIQHVAFDGTMKAEVAPWKGMYVKDANSKIIEDLTSRGLLFANEKVQHSYPHCWRCETPLLNYATESWFMKTEELCEKMIANNQKIHWMPEHLKDGRFGKWLEGVRDWCISRNRYWGTPLPVWKCEACEAFVCIGSRQELEKLSGKKTDDLHKHFVDDITFPCQCGNGIMKRIPEVLDCWFESGSMPYAQKHYPFENKKWMEKNYPADFIAEGLDQTRGWFYTLHVLATALSADIGTTEIKPAFKNVVVNGIVLAEDGNKMSKSKKNYPDPHEMFDKYGADAVRFYLMNSPVVRAEDLRFSGKGVSDVVKNVILPIWNAYGFFVMYANIDGWGTGTSKGESVTLRLSKGDIGHHGTRTEIASSRHEQSECLFSSFLKRRRTPLRSVRARNDRGARHDKNRLDRWILSALHELIAEVTREMDGYDLQAISPIYQFIQQLTNWYIRRSRRRFWKSENDADKTEAYQTLYTVLVTLSKLMAPWMPFVSDEIYRNLTGEESVHLTDWPVADSSFIDYDLNEEFRLTQLVVNLGRRARLKANIKVRQPLSRLEVVLPENVVRETLADDIDAIKEELNVKNVEFLRDAAGIATAYVLPDARKLGPKYGAVVQNIIRTAKMGAFEKLPNGNVKVLEYELSPDEISMGYRGKDGFDVEFEDGVVVALDTKITEELREEGMARDIVRQIQEMRKEAGYHVADRIFVSIEASGIIEKAACNFMEYICKETLSEHADVFGAFDLEKKVELEEGSVVLKIRNEK